VRKYEPVGPILKEEAEAALASADADRISDALLRLSLFSEDWRFAQGECLRLLRHGDAGVRGIAATCLGHLARIHRVNDYERVAEALKAVLSDPEMGGRAQDALDDIDVFVKPGD
jgi:hypothetical protein